MQSEEEKQEALVRKEIRSRLTSLFRQTLKDLGFVSKSRRYWIRESTTLFQCCFFEFPRPWYVRLIGGYDFIHSFNAWNDVAQDSQSQKTLKLFKDRLNECARERLCQFKTKDLDIPLSFEKVDAVLAEADSFLKQDVLPFLDKYRESAQILSDYNNGTLDDKYIDSFGEPWFSFNLAMLRFQEKKYAETYVLFRNFLLMAENRKRDELWKTMTEGAELAVNFLEERLDLKETIQQLERRKRQVPKRPPFGIGFGPQDKEKASVEIDGVKEALILTDEEKNTKLVRKEVDEQLNAFFEQTLIPMGFVKKTGRREWLRETKTLRQFCLYEIFQEQHVRISVWYNFIPCFDCWNDVSNDLRTQAILKRFKETVVNLYETAGAYGKYRDLDIPSTSDEIKSIVFESDLYFRYEAFPFLDKYRETSEILADYNAGNIDDKYINDAGEPWFTFNLALLRCQEQKYAETLELFQSFLSKVDDERKKSEFWETIAEGVELVVDSLKKRFV